MNPFAPFRLHLVYRNLTSRRRPNHLGPRVGPSPFLEHYWHMNACYYHRRNPPRRTYNKPDVGNERKIMVDGTNSRYTERGLFLLLDGIGETVLSLAAGATSGGSGGGNGSLRNTLTFPHRFPTFEHGKTHTNGSTSLDIRSSTVSRDRYDREGEIAFRA
jgi:hypothetical protein